MRGPEGGRRCPDEPRPRDHRRLIHALADCLERGRKATAIRRGNCLALHHGRDRDRRPAVRRLRRHGVARARDGVRDLARQLALASGNGPARTPRSGAARLDDDRARCDELRSCARCALAGTSCSRCSAASPAQAVPERASFSKALPCRSTTRSGGSKAPAFVCAARARPRPRVSNARAESPRP